MTMRYIYKGSRIKDEKGNNTSFYVDSKGRVYEDFDGTIRKVGKMTRDGGMDVKTSYARKYKDRLNQILKKETSKPKELGHELGDQTTKETADESN